MKIDIVSKLNQHIANGFRKESDVVYLFVQIRKLLEQQQNTKFPVLRFYCNWVLHYKLNSIDKNPEMKSLLDKMNEAFSLHYSGVKKKKILENMTQGVSFYRLWKELEIFFNSVDGFSRDMLNKKQSWKSFNQLLIDVLINQPLVPPEGRYPYIKECRFTYDKNHKYDYILRIQAPNRQVIKAKFCF